MKNIKKLALCAVLLGIVSVSHASFVKRGFDTSRLAVEKAVHGKLRCIAMSLKLRGDRERAAKNRYMYLQGKIRESFCSWYYSEEYLRSFYLMDQERSGLQEAQREYNSALAQQGRLLENQRNSPLSRRHARLAKFAEEKAFSEIVAGEDSHSPLQ